MTGNQAKEPEVGLAKWRAIEEIQEVESEGTDHLFSVFNIKGIKHWKFVPPDLRGTSAFYIRVPGFGTLTCLSTTTLIQSPTAFV